MFDQTDRNTDTVIGIDLGGTNLRGGLVNGNTVTSIVSRRIHADKTSDEVLAELFAFIDNLVHPSVRAIGLGVPGMVSADKVFDVVYIPAWKEIPLRALLEERYQVPVLVENDANCFALGEFYFGKGMASRSMIGLTIGTGLGAGIIINEMLHPGEHGCAGEFGMIDYLDHCYEYYASGQFFTNVYQMDGEKVFAKALQGDPAAQKMYEEMGRHLGNAIKMILYATGVELIILGGSVRHAFPFFANAMWERIQTFAFKKSIRHLKIEVSELENSGILGAAALHFNVNHRK